MAHHETIHSNHAPAALGPYSQAVALDVGDRKLLFLAGQIPLDPDSGELVDGPIALQVDRVMANIRAVLQAAGSDLARVVKTTIFLADMADFAEVNEAYGRYFAESPPARSTVEAACLPKSCRVEIEVVAYS